METKLKQRDNSECLVNTAELLRKLRQKAEEAEWTGAPNANRLRHEYDLMRRKYGDGEVLTPLF